MSPRDRITGWIMTSLFAAGTVSRHARKYLRRGVAAMSEWVRPRTVP